MNAVDTGERIGNVSLYRYAMFVAFALLVTVAVSSAAYLVMVYLVTPSGFAKASLDHAPGDVLSVLSFLFLVGFLLAVPFWIWTVIAGYLPFRFARKVAWLRTKKQGLANACAGLTLAIVGAMPMIWLVIDDVIRRGSSGAASAGALAIIVAVITTPLLATRAFAANENSSGAART